MCYQLSKQTYGDSFRGVFDSTSYYCIIIALLVMSLASWQILGYSSPLHSALETLGSVCGQGLRMPTMLYVIQRINLPKSFNWDGFYHQKRPFVLGLLITLSSVRFALLSLVDSISARARTHTQRGLCTHGRPIWTLCL